MKKGQTKINLVEMERLLKEGYTYSAIAKINPINASKIKTKFNIYVPFLYRPDSEGMTIYYTYEEFVGHVFDLTGIYTFHKSTSGNISYQIVPRDSNDLVLIS